MTAHAKRIFREAVFQIFPVGAVAETVQPFKNRQLASSQPLHCSHCHRSAVVCPSAARRVCANMQKFGQSSARSSVSAYSNDTPRSTVSDRGKITNSKHVAVSSHASKGKTARVCQCSDGTSELNGASIVLCTMLLLFLILRPLSCACSGLACWARVSLCRRRSVRSRRGVGPQSDNHCGAAEHGRLYDAHAHVGSV